MKSINYSGLEKKIKFQKINPFQNICKVSGIYENCNIEIEYIPNLKILEIQSYRNYFKQTFNLYIEEIADTVFLHIQNLIEPKYLKVEVFLIDENLTPRSVIIEKTF